MLYITACLFVVYSLKKVIKDKKILIIILTFLLFNPISYSSELFQRLYRNSILHIELLFLLGTTINIIVSKKNNVFNYIFLGFIISIMFLTKEDTIWAKLILLIIIIYKLYKNFKFKNICINLIPILIIILNLNIVSYINYKKYNIYTYNELTNSYFKDAYIKILQIKDDEKIEKIAIPKSTFYKLADNSKVFGFSREQIDNLYLLYGGEDKEIPNSNIIWMFRTWIYDVHKFKNGREANEYFYNLSEEIEELFKEGKLEKEFVFPSVFMNPPSLDDIKQLPKNFAKTIYYTLTYKNIRTFPEKEMSKIFNWDNIIGAYKINYYDSHNVGNIVEDNLTNCEVIRKIYEVFTITFSIVAFGIYSKNIRTRDLLNGIIHIIFLIYLVILCGVTYTHVTAFDAIRYCYLGNIYILQNLFILLNLYRIYDKYKNKITRKR